MRIPDIEEFTNDMRREATLEGERRRLAYLKKYPLPKQSALCPAGWDDKLKPKKQRRK